MKIETGGTPVLRHRPSLRRDLRLHSYGQVVSGVRPSRAQKHPYASGRTFVRLPAEERFCARDGRTPVVARRIRLPTEFCGRAGEDSGAVGAAEWLVHPNKLSGRRLPARRVRALALDKFAPDRRSALQTR